MDEVCPSYAEFRKGHYKLNAGKVKVRARSKQIVEGTTETIDAWFNRNPAEQ
ncbi:MAG: hypothetical protein WCX64_04825 [Candidatus Micrarchaeia archaeon]|jgi:hypothetical protein